MSRYHICIPTHVFIINKSFFFFSAKQHSQQAVSRTALTVTGPSDTAIKAPRLKSHVIVWLRQRSHFLLPTPPQLPLIVPQGSLTEPQPQPQNQPQNQPPLWGPAGLVVVPGEAGSSLLHPGGNCPAIEESA